MYCPQFSRILMPSFPGLSASMPSRVHEDEPFMWDNFFSSNFLDDIDNNLLSDQLFNTLDLEPLPYEDGLFENGASATLNLPNEIKRDCLLGKPEDQCLRECGADCDPLRYVVRHCACGSNMAIAHNCHCEESLRLAVNPQMSLPLPYSPYNDHCYYQTIDPNSDGKQTSSDSFESESLTDDDSSDGQIIDVVTPVANTRLSFPNPITRHERKSSRKHEFPNSDSVSSRRQTTTRTRRSRSLQEVPAKQSTQYNKFRIKRPSKKSSSNTDVAGKRSARNNKEKKRRSVHSNMFQELRILVPSIKNSQKASKVVILNEAAKYVTKLVEHEKQNVITKRNEERKNVALQRRLKQLLK